jgi:hypothetical protein
MPSPKDCTSLAFGLPSGLSVSPPVLTDEPSVRFGLYSEKVDDIRAEVKESIELGVFEIRCRCALKEKVSLGTFMGPRYL